MQFHCVHKLKQFLLFIIDDNNALMEILFFFNNFYYVYLYGTYFVPKTLFTSKCNQ